MHHEPHFPPDTTPRKDIAVTVLAILAASGLLGGTASILVGPPGLWLCGVLACTSVVLGVAPRATRSEALVFAGICCLLLVATLPVGLIPDALKAVGIAVLGGGSLGQLISAHLP